MIVAVAVAVTVAVVGALLVLDINIDVFDDVVALFCIVIAALGIVGQTSWAGSGYCQRVRPRAGLGLAPADIRGTNLSFLVLSGRPLVWADIVWVVVTISPSHPTLESSSHQCIPRSDVICMGLSSDLREQKYMRN